MQPFQCMGSPGGPCSQAWFPHSHKDRGEGRQGWGGRGGQGRAGQGDSRAQALKWTPPSTLPSYLQPHGSGGPGEASGAFVTLLPEKALLAPGPWLSVRSLWGHDGRGEDCLLLPTAERSWGLSGRGRRYSPRGPAARWGLEDPWAPADPVGTDRHGCFRSHSCGPGREAGGAGGAPGPSAPSPPRGLTCSPLSPLLPFCPGSPISPCGKGWETRQP